MCNARQRLAISAADMIALLVLRQNMLHQPVTQGFRVLDRGFTETKVLANLRTVVLRGAAFQIVLIPGGLRNTDMAGGVFDDGRRNFLPVPGETSLVLEIFEHDSEAQAVGPFLLASRSFSSGRKDQCSAS